MQKFTLAVVLLVTLLLQGCAQLSELASYRITEPELARLVQNQLEQANAEVRVMGFGVPLEINSLQAEIGPNDSDLVRLKGDFLIAFEVFGRKYPVELKLGVEGAPIYDGNENAIYVRRLNIIDSSISAAGFSGSLNSIDQQVLAILDQFLAQQPVYRLNPNDRTQSLLMQVPLSLHVDNGALRISPTR